MITRVSIWEYNNPSITLNRSKVWNAGWWYRWLIGHSKKPNWVEICLLLNHKISFSFMLEYFLLQLSFLALENIVKIIWSKFDSWVIYDIKINHNNFYWVLIDQSNRRSRNPIFAWFWPGRIFLHFKKKLMNVN